jgi:hypothetical protein
VSVKLLYKIQVGFAVRFESGFCKINIRHDYLAKKIKNLGRPKWVAEGTFVGVHIYPIFSFTLKVIKFRGLYLEEEKVLKF